MYVRNAVIAFVLENIIKTSWSRGVKMSLSESFSSLNEWQSYNSCNAWIIYWSFLCALFWIFAICERLGSQMAGAHAVL